jgi:cytochrome c-type biogenesis protein CcmH/NrfG
LHWRASLLTASFFSFVGSAFLGAAIPAPLRAFTLLGSFPAQNGFAIPSTITIRLRDKAGNTLQMIPSIKVYEEGGGVYSSTPRQNGDEWYIEIRTPGKYVVEVAVPGYKRVEQSVQIAGRGENDKLDVTMEPEGKDANVVPPANEVVLAPKALEEKKKGAKALREKNYPEAKMHLEKALQLAPGSSEINYLTGVLHMKTGNLSGAVQSLQKAVSLDSKNSSALFSLGEALYRQGHVAEAAETLERGLLIKPSAWPEEWLLSSVYYDEAKYDLARQHAQTALALGKDDAASVEFLLAKCEAQLGQKKEAIASLQSFLTKQPSAPEAPQAQAILKQLQAAP